MPMNWLRRLLGYVEPVRPPDEPVVVLPMRDENPWRTEVLALLDEVGAADTADAAAWTLWDRVQAMDARGWVRVDEMLRPWLWSNDWSRSLRWLRGGADVRRLAVPTETGAAVFGLLASHSSGFVREAVVQRLALVGGGDEMPPLLLRANDWVPQVRGRAVDALRARLVPAYAGAWVRWLPLVLRLDGRGREDARPLVDAVMALLRAPEAADAVWAGLHSPDHVVRRTCFGILERAGGAVLRRLVDESLRSADVILRRGAVRVAGALDDESLAAVLPRLVRDPLPRVRRDALALAAERLPGPGLRWAREALLDRATGVRAEAQRIVQRLAPMDLAAFYRGEVRAGNARPAPAVMGLAQTGRPEDAALVRPLLGHAQPRVRAAAVYALARLGGASELAVLLRSVGDAHPSVSRAAAAALRDGVRRISVAELTALYRDSAAAHVRQSALSLLAARGKWESIPWILRALRDPDEDIRRRARTYLNRWRHRFNRVSSQPTPDHLRELRDAVEAAADALDAETRDWLRFAAGLPR